MARKRQVDPEFVQTLEELAEAWESSLGNSNLLSHEREQTYGYSVRQFIKWVKQGQSARLPRSRG